MKQVKYFCDCCGEEVHDDFFYTDLTFTLPYGKNSFYIKVSLRAKELPDGRIYNDICAQCGVDILKEFLRVGNTLLEKQGKKELEKSAGMEIEEEDK